MSSLSSTVTVPLSHCFNPNLFTFSISSVSVSDPYPQNTKTFNNNKCCESKSWKETRVSGVSRGGGGGGTEGSSGSSGDCFLQNGGFAMALLSITSTARGRLSPFMATLAANPTFLSGMLAWMIAQSMKMFLNFFVESKWDFRIIFASGGMPSSHSALCTALTSHSALCTALTTSVAISHGVADSLFPVCLGFSLIVMYDAIGVRRHAGMQAQVLNVIIADLFQGHPISQRKLKELLGHTPSQVFAGAVLGILVAAVCCRSYLVAA